VQHRPTDIFAAIPDIICPRRCRQNGHLRDFPYRDLRDRETAELGLPGKLRMAGLNHSAFRPATNEEASTRSIYASGDGRLLPTLEGGGGGRG